MKKQIKIALKIAWLAAVVAILLMGTDVCLSATNATCYQAGETMLLLMFWLSFPTGIVFALAGSAFLGDFPSDFITTWMVMACGGFIQWFVVVPRLFEKKELTLLNLRKAAPIERDNSEPLNAPTPEPAKISNMEWSSAKPANTINEISRPTRTRRKTTRRIAAFDRRGRTPLERVIDNL